MGTEANFLRNFLRILALIGVLLLILLSAWFGIAIYASQKQKELSKKWDEEFDSFETLEKRFPKQSANRSALELEKLSAKLGINLTPRDFRNRVRIEEQKHELVKTLSKDLSKVLENRLNHERSDQIEMSAELQHFLTSNQQALQTIVSSTILNEVPVWELNLGRHISAPIPNLPGHMALQRLINLQASVFIEESRIVEADDMLEASWKINEQLLKRPEELPYLVGQNILRLQQGNLRQIPIADDVWHARLKNPEIVMQLWNVLESSVLVILKAANEGALWKDEKNKKSSFGILSPYIRLMVLDWAKVMHFKIIELKMRDPCAPKEPIKVGEEKRLFASWNRIGQIMFHDPAHLWNRSMRLRFDLELTDKIIEINKKLHNDPGSFGDAFSFDSSICKGEKWNYQRTSAGFKLAFSKNIDWSVGELPEYALFLPDTYTGVIVRRAEEKQ